MRNYWACPDCGFIFRDFEDEPPHKPIDCPTCKAHFTVDDFIDENCDKWDRTAVIEGELESQEAALEEYIKSKRE